MKVFNYKVLKEMKWDNEIVNYLSLIHEYRAKEKVLKTQKVKELDKLVEIAKIQSTESSNEIEGIRTTNTRLKQLVTEKTTPKNRDEEEISGYRDVLNIIHDNYEYISITPNYILQLHKTLYSHSSKSIGGSFKNVQNYISGVDCNGKSYTLFTPLAPYETPKAIEDICDEFNKALASNEVDPLILIPIFIHDFLCIHPFLDGNGRMSRLLTTLLLYKCGYYIGRYISLESKISKTKDAYYYALDLSQQGWYENIGNPEAFIKYILGTIISAYRDLEDRIDIVNDKLSSMDIVRNAISNVIGKFNKSNLVELCPTLGVKSIELALKKLVDDGMLEKLGNGKNTYYVRKNM